MCDCHGQLHNNRSVLTVQPLSSSRSLPFTCLWTSLAPLTFFPAGSCSILSLHYLSEYVFIGWYSKPFQGNYLLEARSLFLSLGHFVRSSVLPLRSTFGVYKWRIRRGFAVELNCSVFFLIEATTIAFSVEYSSPSSRKSRGNRFIAVSAPQSLWKSNTELIVN